MASYKTETKQNNLCITRKDMELLYKKLVKIRQKKKKQQKNWLIFLKTMNFKVRKNH